MAENGTWDGRARVPRPDLSLLSMDDETQAATMAGEGELSGPYDDELPERIGRYLILDELGAGAMGVVYAAYDPDLDRKLALKVLHDDLEHSKDRTLRLLREAQALARVSHPNVIQVYDVGTFDAQVYIAMEFVDGCVLGDWLAAETRTIEAILAAFVSAGRGLEAAHDKGLVHRDFKPENVLVANDGRVVVLDFGIAHAVGKVDDERVSSDALVRSRIVEHSANHSLVMEKSRRGDALGELSESGSNCALDTELTRVGALIGTPSYMAPEQLEGRRTDERSDQFSFCVALWQAIYGRRPYAGDSPLALWQAMQKGRLRAPSKSRLPGVVQRAVQRGLAIDPDKRFDTMAELLAILARDAKALRRRVGFGLVTATALTLAAWSSARTLEPAPVCQGAEQRLEGIWDAPRRAALVEAYGASELPLAQQVLPPLLTKLDAYAQGWKQMYTDACEATHVRQEQSEELLDLRMRCLDARKLGLDTLVEVLLEPDATVIQNSYAAVSELRAISRCADQAALVARVAPPEDAPLAAAVGEIERAIARAAAHRAAGDHQRGLELALAAKVQAEPTLYAPLEAVALIELGKNMVEVGNYDEAEQTLRAGFYRALAAGDDEAAADAAINLVLVSGDRQQQFEAAHNWAKIADAILTRHEDRDLRARVELQYLVGVSLWREDELERSRVELERALELATALGEDQRLLEIRVRKGLGSTLWSQGKPEAASEQFQIAVDTLAQELGATHPRVASALNNLASAHFSLAKLELAEQEFLRALEITESSLGPNHPSVANGLNNLAVVYTKRGKLEQARDTHLHVLELNERVLGADHPQLANSWTNLGRVLRMLHDYEGAVDYYGRAYARCESALGPEHSDTSSALAGLALTQLASGPDSGLVERGRANFERVYAVQARVLGPDHPKLAELVYEFGEAFVKLGELEQGTRLLHESLTVREQILAADHRDLANSIAALAHAHVEAGEDGEAAPLLERFFALEQAASPGQLICARARLDHARLLGEDQPRALAQAHAGLEQLTLVEGPDAKQLRRALEEFIKSPSRAR